MKNHVSFRVAFLLVLVAFAVQGCLGIGGSSNQGNFKSENTGNGQKIGVNQTTQAVFKGKIYFTQGRNLLVLDGSRTVKQLTHGEDVRDPAVSPDGKWVAFDVRYGDYANLVYMSVNGGPQHVVISGNGHYWTNSGGFPQDDFYWFGQPAWSDNSHLTFLSDFQKNFDWAQLAAISPAPRSLICRYFPSLSPTPTLPVQRARPIHRSLPTPTMAMAVTATLCIAPAILRRSSTPTTHMTRPAPTR